MIALLQRVTQAHVAVDSYVVGEIQQGLMVLLGVERGDSETEAQRLLERLIGYRVFADKQGKMNLNVQQINGALLLVPQFTLVANTRKGTRPSFSSAARPEDGERLFNNFVSQAKKTSLLVQTGQFGANMAVSLTNDGPVTFWLQVSPPN
ncbi:D-aminoacyl-tRNA deacylase [hydrothermal vent metagenome]|uniref:D-aminoacyl-tRNA deacylase n=1 Tax=hydrothermal vent metagenome TaxID=652676 RepID=A0A3B0YTK6_9ZZZZ